MQYEVSQLAAAVLYRVRAAAAVGARRAAQFLAGKVREAVSEPAPVLGVRPPSRLTQGGTPTRRTVTPATAGSPPRRVTGRLERSVHVEGAAVVVDAVSDGGFPYPVFHEVVTPGRVGSGEHPFLAPTAAQYADQVAEIVLGNVGV